MSEPIERIAIVETKVSNLEDKIDTLKQEVKDDNTEIKGQLQKMYDASCSQHAELGRQLRSLENKSYYVMGAIAVASPILMFIVTQIDWRTIFGN